MCAAIVSSHDIMCGPGNTPTHSRTHTAVSGVLLRVTAVLALLVRPDINISTVFYMNSFSSSASVCAACTALHGVHTLNETSTTLRSVASLCSILLLFFCLTQCNVTSRNGSVLGHAVPGRLGGLGRDTSILGGSDESCPGGVSTSRCFFSLVVVLPCFVRVWYLSLW